MGKIAFWILFGFALASTKFNVAPKNDENDFPWPWDTECPALTESGPITISQNSQVVENLLITAGDSQWVATGGDYQWTAPTGIVCNGFSDVKIKNVYVKHYPQGVDAHKGSKAEKIFQKTIEEHPEANPVALEYVEHDLGLDGTPAEDLGTTPYSLGIHFKNCQNLTIENVRVELVDPPQGALSYWMNYNIYGEDSDNILIKDVILSGGSSSIWVKNCNKAVVSNWAAYNIHGPFPRGQCIQTSYCMDVTIEKFICKNQWQYSYTEDAMSLWRTSRSTVTNGVILGENSPTGVGLMMEESDILDTDKSTLYVNVSEVYAKGCSTCFSTYGGTNVTWDNVGCRDNYCGQRGGRNSPKPSGLMWYSGWENPSNVVNCCTPTNLKLENSKFWNTCRMPWIMTNKTKAPNAWAQRDLIAEDFTINEYPISLNLCFKINGQEWKADTREGTDDSHIKNLGLKGNGGIDADSDYDVNAVETWGECEDTCKTSSTTWETKCYWTTCRACLDCTQYWPHWVENTRL